MKINLPSYTQHYALSPIKTKEDAEKYNFSFTHDVDADYSIYWGLPTTKLHMHKKFGVMESGFFLGRNVYRYSRRLSEFFTKYKDGI